jgi:hypothetical protein
MEDWAYASSWDPDLLLQCEPTTFGGYPSSKTTYSDSSLRVFNILVETSNDKIPSTGLGTTLDVLNPESEGNGHIPRNLRLSLLSVDLVEPYVWFTEVNNILLASDIIPLQDRSGRSCQRNNVTHLSAEDQVIQLKWMVGGGFEIEQTEIWYAKWDDMPASMVDCLSQPSITDIREFMKSGTPIGATSGTGMFSSDGPTEFRATIDLSDFTAGEEIVILASARVDQSWSEQPGSAMPQVPPQSHIANARTNPNWYHESERNIVQGRLDWFSSPLTVFVPGDAIVHISSPTGRESPAG